VSFASAQPPAVTFNNSTGPNGRRHCKQASTLTNKHKKNLGTGSKSRRQDTAAHLEALPPATHFALHGDAFNPDAGKIAKCPPKLSRCSEGDLWQQFNAEEIGSLAQDLGIAATNAMFFIPITDMPRDCKATHLQFISAYHPGKISPLSPLDCWWQSNRFPRQR
jgi:hypothetical protein